MTTLKLEMFNKEEYDFKTHFAEMHCVDYLLESNGYRIKVYQVFGAFPYMIALTYPNGYTGEASGFETAEEALDYLNKNVKIDL